MKLIFICITVILISGCSTFQSSQYTNYNTPYGNVVQATGKAANNAALANTSTNCPSCALNSNQMQLNSHRVLNDYRSDQDFMSEITRSTLYTLSSEVRQEIDSVIRKAFE